MGFFNAFLELIFGSGDTLKPITKDPFICPQCNLELKLGENGLHLCGGCYGVWLPNDLFQDLLQDHTLDSKSEGPGGGQHTYQRSSSPRTCPACESAMDNYQFAYQSGIWIDACGDRHGVWLDSGELEMVRLYHQQSSGRDLTSDEKARWAMAFLDGAAQSRENLNAVNRQLQADRDRRNESYESYYEQNDW